jgi:hypothetical protein
MSMLGIPQLMLPATELKATMTGSSVLVGTLLQTPLKLILDNLSTVSVIIFISFDGGTTKTQWKTFAAGSAIVLDDDLWTFPKGTSFYGVGASGDFSVAYTYVKQ